MNLQQARDLVDAHFERRLPLLDFLPELQVSARHVVAGAGKALRPALLFAAYNRETGRSGTPSEAALDAALALELLHSYSLVHDDLPCMDNAEHRRGRPTLHRLHQSEAAGVLAGDALLTAAFEVLTFADIDATARIRAVRELASAAGGAGMVAGQWRDMYFPIKNLGQKEALAELERTHMLKTGALFGAALSLGALMAGARAEQRLAELRRLGARFGIFFQVVDDVIDVLSTSTQRGRELGKSLGRDAAADKATYASVLGVPEAVALARRLREEMIAAHSWLAPFTDAALERLES